MKKKLKNAIAKRRGHGLSERVPRITNETVAAHREEVLGSARKYIYPLQHSKHRIVLISVALFILTVVIFFTYCTIALYRLQSNSTFLYRVTQVIPFPVARAGDQFVAYENYLFELRHYQHYYENQLATNFDDPRNRPQLDDFKRRALDKVVNDAYVKQLAREHDITVSNQELDDQITIVRNQNRLGGDEEVFEDVLRDYWGWSVTDFRRTLRQEMLAQKVAAKLDRGTQRQADVALSQLRRRVPFKDVARRFSDDVRTRNDGGELPSLVSRTDRNFSAQMTDALFKLRPGQTSGIINTGYALEILRNLEREGDRIRAAHILFSFQDISTYVNNLKEDKPTKLYIRMPEMRRQPTQPQQGQPATQPQVQNQPQPGNQSQTTVPTTP